MGLKMKHENDSKMIANEYYNAAQSLTYVCHKTAFQSGWWHNLQTGELLTGVPSKRNVPELFCLVHSEISEAMEGYRKNLPDDKLPHRSMLEVELADALIRIFDLAGGLQLDVAGALVEKLAYNAQRADHKKENRLTENGKKF